MTLLPISKVKALMCDLSRNGYGKQSELYSQAWNGGLMLPNGNRLIAFKRGEGHSSYRVVSFGDTRKEN